MRNKQYRDKKRGFGDKKGRRDDRRPDRGQRHGDKSHNKRGDRHKEPERKARPERPQGPAITANLWGVHAVTEAWLNPARRIKKFHATEQALMELGPVLQKAGEAGLERPEPILVERHVLDRALSGAVHQGLALEAEPLEEVFVQDLAVRAAAQPKAILVMLDQVTDPHNVGAVMRSASAFGAAGLIMQSRNAPEINGTMAKAACGALEHIPVAYETNLSRTIEYLQEQGFTVIGLDERGEKTLAEIPVPEKALIVLGAEGRGMRQNLREHCDALVRLPTQGAILSLNVSNAAAVALYALTSS